MEIWKPEDERFRVVCRSLGGRRVGWPLYGGYSVVIIRDVGLDEANEELLGLFNSVYDAGADKWDDVVSMRAGHIDDAGESSDGRRWFREDGKVFRVEYEDDLLNG